ncbi:MAG: 3-isopropylmalate dehydrogenase [Ardenticatenaceae bacterium]|nr:3-isopropylmalate dehydrogenase [Anaerolineales bacterium]MCB8921527.1 3-isopropylmalate dehydrogenase [Ardenticatenaceae bacterium]MCB8990933.1 3-isopropylmalate dehydrogenase [Ardenticatenaceae bacterium]
MRANIVVLPGDGIGPEVVEGALAVLTAVAHHFNHTFITSTHLMGGCAIDEMGTSLPDETLNACLQADAVLLGAVGGYKWDNPDAKDRPERGLLALRKGLDLFANLRPLKLYPELMAASPLKAEKLTGVDMLVIRELTGGIYFGDRARWTDDAGEEWGKDTMIYSAGEVRRVAEIAFNAAQGRRKRVASIDKANVLDSSRLWRKTVTAVAAQYPDVTLEHVLVDAATMHLLSRPASFDVLVAGNMFGDIITDEASMLSGSMGNLPSASLGEAQNQHGYPRGLYEPIHGSAPDIAGMGIANPIGTIMSVAMLLRHSLGLEDEAAALETAVARTISAGHRTADLARSGEPSLSTQEMTAVIVQNLQGKEG